MTDTATPAPEPASDSDKPSGFADMATGAVVAVIAVGIVVMSWNMDRMAHLQASIYSAPGLVPGVLGLSLLLMGIVLALRGRRAALTTTSTTSSPRFRLASEWRLGLTLAMCLGFAVVAVGSGIPFWLAAAVYVALFVFIFGRIDAPNARPTWQRAAFAALYGLAAGVAIHMAFEKLFFVRLP